MKNTITIDVKANIKGNHTRKLRYWVGMRLMTFAAWLMRTEIELELESNEKHS